VTTRSWTATLSLVASLSAPAAAQDAPPDPQDPASAPVERRQDDDGGLTERPKKHSDKDDLPGWHYGSKGIQYRSEKGRFYQWFTLRNQVRWSTPFDETPTSPDDIPAHGEGDADLALNRSRLKFGGYIGSPRLQNFVEIDLRHQRMYHFFTTVTIRDWLEVRAGQWKVPFNRERVDSSGDQELVDRSIVNRDFTLDGQAGAMVQGRVFKQRAADGNYFLAVLAGEGRLALNDDAVPMVLARYQWNLFKREVDFSQSDVEFHPEPVAAIGIAAVRGVGRYTRYSSDGGAQLEGFETTVDGRYELRQWMTDIAFFRRGVSFQGEHHWKRVIDRVAGGGRRLRGGYLQAGFFPVREWSRHLSALEVGGRIAYVDPDTAASDDMRYEMSGVLNWYLNQHRNKISFDFGRLIVGPTSGPRIRLQWDLSL